MTGEREATERPRIGMTILKWLAPLCSGAVLGFLIMRASLQSDEPPREPPPPPPPPVAAAVEPPAQAAEVPKPDQPQPDAAVPGFDDLGAPRSNSVGYGNGFLGGSKSGTLDVGSIREEPAP